MDKFVAWAGGGIQAIGGKAADNLSGLIQRLDQPVDMSQWLPERPAPPVNPKVPPPDARAEADVRATQHRASASGKGSGTAGHAVDAAPIDRLAKGDAVHVWSNSKNQWIEDGIVQDIASADVVHDGYRISTGSALVVFAGGSCTKWVLAGSFQQFLRKAGAPQGPPPVASIRVVATPGSDEVLAELRSVELACRLEGHPYEDPEFSVQTSGRVTRWCRPREIQYQDGRPLKPSEDWQLFRGTPSAEDVQQGELGNCWFLSSLAALAEFRGGRFVRALLPEQEHLNPAGAYVVRLCLGGRWRDIMVDDRLPCIGREGYYTQLAYCVTRRLQLWASLVEKGFAKVCGSYDAIVGGEACEALSVLTGWPCTVIRFDRKSFDTDIFWATLCSSRAASFLMTCSTGDDETACRSEGLVPNHAYSLIDVLEVVGTSGNSIRLLKLRNPHAKTRWQGAWSDTSPLWTPDLRRQVDFPECKGSGIFFMALGDFMSRFASCTICRIRSETWHEARRLVQLPSGEVPHVGWELEVFETTECAVSIVQPELRARRGPLYKTLDLGHLACAGFVLLASDQSRGPGVAAAVGKLRSSDVVSADCFLQAGRSYLLVPLSMHDGKAVQAVCACVSSRLVVLTKRSLDRETVRSAWVEYAKSNTDRGTSTFRGATLHTTSASGGSIVAFAENRGWEYFKVKLTYNSEHLRFARGTSATSDWLAPGYGQLLQVALPDAACGGNTGWASQHEFESQLWRPFQPWHDPEVETCDTGFHAPFPIEK